MLCALARVQGKLVTKNALRDMVWGHRFVTDAVLKSTISEVRAALDDDPKQPRYIETVWRHGYRFIAAAVSSPTQSPAAVERKGAGGPDHPALAALMALAAAMPRWPISSARSLPRWSVMLARLPMRRMPP